MARRARTAGGDEAHPLASIARPGTIRCMRCEQDKPAAGARPFHALHVCAECVRKLAGIQQKGQAHGATS
jgi:hypothetical protein